MSSLDFEQTPEVVAATVPVESTPEVAVANRAVEAEQPRRHIIGKAVAALALTACGALYGAWTGATAPTKFQLGPHDATAQLTTNYTSTLEFKPVGAFILPQKSRIGAKVSVGAVPYDPKLPNTSLISDDTIKKYERLLDDKQHIAAEIRDKIEEHASREGRLYGYGSLALYLLALNSLAIARNKMDPADIQAFRDVYDVIARIAKQTLPVVVATSAILAATGVAAFLDKPAPSYADSSPMSPFLSDKLPKDGPFKNIRIQGAYMHELVDQLAPQFLYSFVINGAYYDKAQGDLEAAFAQQVGKLPSVDPDTKQKIKRVLVISDNHCNYGMDRVFGSAARLFGADLVIDAGDITADGTTAEDECVSSERDSLKGIPLVTAGGNLDSTITLAQAKKHGMTVLEGKTQTVAGVRVLGGSSSEPSKSSLTTLTQQGPASVDDLGRQLRDEACSDQPDILVTYQPKAAIPTAQAGCAKLTISGKDLKISGPNAYPTADSKVSYQYTEGTTGGTSQLDGLPVVGPLENPGVMTVFEFDSGNNLLGTYYTITVLDTDASAIIEKQFLPIPPNGYQIPVSQRHYPNLLS